MHEAAEAIEKVQMLNSGIFGSVKINNLQDIENHKMAQFRVFRQARYL
jgi:hypothetical protein